MSDTKVVMSILVDDKKGPGMSHRDEQPFSIESNKRQDLLWKFQFDVMCPWTTLKELSVHTRLFDHLRMH